jgi:5-methylcytosine-specific restriction endonuclease McrA
MPNGKVKTEAYKWLLPAERKSLTPKQRETIFLREHGICHICGFLIDTVREEWEADHLIAYELTGKSGKDFLEEYKPAHIKCHDVKTADDMKIIVKNRNVRHKHLGIKKKSKNPMPGSRNSRWKRRMDGTVEER